MSTNENFVENVSEEQVTNSINESILEDNSSYKNIIKKLIASGCKRINSVRIKNVNFTDKDNYTMVSFTISPFIDSFVSKDNGMSYERGKTNIIFTSLYAIAGAIKEDDELSWMANSLLERPQILNLIFNGSTIDIIQQEISAGEEFRNPFSSKRDSEPQVYDHDLIINHIISFKLGSVGNKMADRLADKLMESDK